LKPSIPKGTRDFGHKQVLKRNYIFNSLKEVFQLHAYFPLETPTMENLSTLTGKYGDEGDQLIFKVLNSGNYLENISDEEFKNPKKRASFFSFHFILLTTMTRYPVDRPQRFFAAHEVMSMSDSSMATKLTVQFNLFGGTILK
jgi:hypothetical protein